MSGDYPPGFPAPREVVLALPSQSEPFEEPGSSHGSVMGPARATPSDPASDYWDGMGSDQQWGQSSGYDMWDDLEAEPSQEDVRATASPAIIYTPVPLTSDPYTPVMYSSTYSPANPSDYRPPPPVTDQEIYQRATTIL